jgi:predicted metal-dependent hydrolase
MSSEGLLGRLMGRLVPTPTQKSGTFSASVPYERALSSDLLLIEEGTQQVAWIHPRANRAINLEGRWAAFYFCRSSRKSLGFVVKPEGLEVRAPHRMGWEVIDRGLHRQAQWIWKKHAEQTTRLEHLKTDVPWVCTVRGQQVHEGFVTLLGRQVVWYQVETKENDTNRPVVDKAAKESTLLHLYSRKSTQKGQIMACDLEVMGIGAVEGSVPISWDQCWAALAHSDPLLVLQLSTTGKAKPGIPIDNVNEMAFIHVLLDTWIKQAALQLFEWRMAYWAESMQVQPKTWRLTRAQTRWGSASSQGHIRLHASLIHLPLALVDYVIVHELAHLREMNHSPRFWAVVGAVMPDYLERRRILKQHRPLADSPLFPAKPSEAM